MDKMTFEVKQEHIKLLQRMYVGWNNCEFGAPEIDPKRPYGNRDVYGDMCEILGMKSLDDEERPDWKQEGLDKIHKETKTALQILLRCGKLEVGVYEADKYDTNWRLCQ